MKKAVKGFLFSFVCAVATAAFFLTASGCGKKTAPKPPIENNAAETPATTTNDNGGK
ncbi:MAG: hypothetical protein OEV59_04010 [Deltaproteobacteria bacterium]|nr:hypothetical protein [Deltaproteobacteria bacterium]